MTGARASGSRSWVLVASVWLGACVGMPVRGTPGRYAQSLDSATSACQKNPAFCARMAGEETVVPQAAQRLVEVGTKVGTLKAALEPDVETRIEQALKECAEQARTGVLLREMNGRIPTPEECNGVMPGKDVTLAMFLGEEMHKEALQCAGERLSRLSAGRFSLEPRYRYNPETNETTVISEEEAQTLLRQWRGNELKGTLRPDVVIHKGHPLQAMAVYDFKFPCANRGSPTSWSTYPKGSPHQGLSQKQVYEQALRVSAWRVIPWEGILP